MIRTIRLPLVTSVALALAGCGPSSQPSTSDAESAIVDVSHDHLSAPDCEDAVGREGESGEASFYCGAAEDDGRRIKLFVSIDDESGDALVLAWRCAAPSLSWKQVRQNPRRRCGTVVGARGAG